MRSKATWLALTVSAGAGVGFALLALIPEPVLVAGTSSESWEVELSACMAPGPALAVSDSEAKECALGVMRRAVDGNQVAQILTATTRVLDRLPNFLPVCHYAGHQAGQYAFSKYNDPGFLLRLADSTACAYALGHGILDGFALESPSIEEFAEVIDVCESFQASRGDLFTACADGAGHAAWTSTQDFSRAFGRCDSFSSAGARSLCAEGVVMQVYEPAGLEASRPVGQAPLDLPRVCASETTSQEASLGCASGAGYVYSRPWWALDARLSSGALQSDFVDSSEFGTIAREVARYCSEHPGPLAAACARGAVSQLPPSARSSALLTNEVCAPLLELAPYCASPGPGSPVSAVRP